MTAFADLSLSKRVIQKFGLYDEELCKKIIILCIDSNIWQSNMMSKFRMEMGNKKLNDSPYLMKCMPSQFV